MSGAFARGAGSALPELFGSATLSDCDMLFCLERQEKERPKKRRRVSKKTAPPAAVLFGEPLSGHLLVLRLASERFNAQMERWDDRAGDRAAQEAASPSSSAARRPQLRVPLGSEAEMPFARAAISYAYTGVVAADGVRAALEVRRQAAYLQINGCAAACDELLVGLLTAGRSSGTGNAAGEGGGYPATADAARPSSEAIEFMACWALLPDPAVEPTFAPVLSAAKEALVRHFGDALAALNTPSLHQQLLQLPAAGVEALLASEAFGTDSEDSVLLLLATWMKANHGQTDAATRMQLCRLVRLVQLGRPYLNTVLPALAADHETCAAGSACAWFPISIAEAGFIANLATAAAGAETERLLCYGCQLYNTKSPYYSTAARPQCLPEEGRTFECAISQKELQEALVGLKPKGRVFVYGSFVGGSRLLCARGLMWVPLLEVEHETTSAGVFLKCGLPAAYDVAGSRLGSSSKFITIAGLEARLVVHGWHGGTPRDAFVGRAMASRLDFALGRALLHAGLGWDSVLPLAQPQQAGADGGGGGSDMMAGWAPYLHDGRLTGTLTLLPVP
ncbi:hypothetical protein TSOC_004374 [Tetrabaena socialis]|uniref:BACK domain-containing protein n=1 Tax=Tetrabaena socialis TaxID=47790 RepID=A0A2J8A953_9CHLO|nr:hypothetical protein TSOC_004374 [Tetrabaena socialis]|eukprot:PNH09057.1 hypothetical protein TSOC_004374 [Tetrabaena socialis]